jgi:hypothetical protein
MSSYSVLDSHEASGSGYELRKYSPQKRTVSVVGRMYFLPIPSTVFLKYWDKRRTILFTGMIKGDLVYQSLFPNVHYNGVCLGGTFYEDENSWNTHFCHKNKKIDDLVARFWSSDFNDYDNWSEGFHALRGNYGYLRDWKNLTMEQAIEKLYWGLIGSADDFILQCIEGLPALLEYDR